MSPTHIHPGGAERCRFCRQPATGSVTLVHKWATRIDVMQPRACCDLCGAGALSSLDATWPKASPESAHWAGSAESANSDAAHFLYGYLHGLQDRLRMMAPSNTELRLMADDIEIALVEAQRFLVGSSTVQRVLDSERTNVRMDEGTK